MGSWRSFCSRRDAVVTFGRDSSWFEPRRRPVIGVRLMMSSSAPPTRSDRACARIVASTAADDADLIVVPKRSFVDGRCAQAFEPKPDWFALTRILVAAKAVHKP